MGADLFSILRCTNLITYETQNPVFFISSFGGKSADCTVLSAYE